MELLANPGKNLTIEVKKVKYARYPIKTHLITPQDKNPIQIIDQYTRGLIQKGDIIFISEKIIAIIQGRAYPVDQIKPSKIASWLSKYVYKNPGGIGLASPETMQLAIEEVGLGRILMAALLAGLTKPLGIKGIFYRLAGDQARAIDGPVPYAIPPYNTYASKGPLRPKKLAQEISQQINCPVAIVDANDFGVRVLGASQGVNKKILVKALKDNPLGQTDQSTPIGILRRLS
jgi:F420-0:gamma-glutamyl ligase